MSFLSNNTWKSRLGFKLNIFAKKWSKTYLILFFIFFNFFNLSLMHVEGSYLLSGHLDSYYVFGSIVESFVLLKPSDAK